METENQSSFILPMPQDFPSGIAHGETYFCNACFYKANFKIQH